MKTTTTSNSRKVLVPLATLLAAAAVAIGSGADWSSSSEPSVSVTSGTLMQDNGKDGVTMTLKNLKPGDVATSNVVVENIGTLDSTIALAASIDAADDFSDALNVKIVRQDEDTDTTDETIYNGAFTGLGSLSDGADAFKAAEGDNAADKFTYVFTVSFADSAAATDQGLTGDVVFTWTQEQLDGETDLVPTDVTP